MLNFSVADDGVTDTLEVTPTIQNGRHVGCQATFGIIRRDPDYFSNRPVYASGSIELRASETIITTSGLLLKIGVALIRDAPHAEAPTAGFFMVDEYESNAHELLVQRDSEHPGFRLFFFPLSDLTTSIIVQSLMRSEFRVAYWEGCIQALTDAAG